MEKSYFDKPTQVVLADSDNPGEWNNIADEIVGGELPSGLFRDSDNKIVETCKMEEWVQMEIADEEATEAEAFFANTWVDGVAMPSVD